MVLIDFHSIYRSYAGLQLEGLSKQLRASYTYRKLICEWYKI